MSVALSFSGINAWYGDKQVLHDVAIALPQTGCTALLGPCGTGKSTLLRCIHSFVDGDIHELREGDWLATCQPSSTNRLPVKVCLVEQKPQPPAGNALHFFSAAHHAPPADVMQALRVLCARHGCDALLPRLFSECANLSRSEWVRMCILSAALDAPDVLLLDEPTAGLSEDEAASVIALISSLALHSSVVVITHHQGHARQLAQHVVLVGSGRVLENLPAASFFGGQGSDAVRHFLRDGTLPQASAAVPLTTNDAIADVEDVVTALGNGLLPASRGRWHAQVPSRFRWVVPDRLAGVSIPGLFGGIEQDMEGLVGCGVHTLVNLTEQPFDSAIAQAYGMHSFFVPVVDMAPPTIEQAVDLCGLLDQQLAQGRCVAVHCKAGQGRTGTVLAAYLLWSSKGQWTGDQAVRAVRRIDSGWIQSSEQVEFLTQFQNFVSNKVTFA